jgi:hypothetical protein
MEITRNSTIASAIMSAVAEGKKPDGAVTADRTTESLRVVQPPLDAITMLSQKSELPAGVAQQLAGTSNAPQLSMDGSDVKAAADSIDEKFDPRSFDISAFFKLMIDQTSEARKSTTAAKISYLNASISKSEDAVDELKSAAFSRFIGGLVGGAFSIGGGLVTTAGGIKGLKVMKDAEATPELQQIKTTEAGLHGQKWQGFGQTLGGLGQIGGAGGSFAADSQQAESQRFEIEARQIDKYFEEIKERGESEKELVKATMDALREYHSQLDQANSKIINA